MSNKNKILVVQYYTDNLKYAKYSESLNKQYCDLQGYDYLVENDSDKIRSFCNDHQIALQWYKVPLLIEMLRTQSKYDWIFFLDMDAIFSNNNKKIEDYLDNSYNLILGSDVGAHSVANTGVIIVKNNSQSLDFLITWWDSRENVSGQEAMDYMGWSGGMNVPENKTIFKSALWHEQTCLSVLLSKNKDLQQYVKIDNNPDINNNIFNSRGFIFHAFGYGFDQSRNLNLIHEAKTSIIDQTKKITIVYFIYCYKDYIDLVTTDFKRIRDVGLYDDCHDISIVYSIPNIEDDTVETDKLNQIFNGYDKVTLHKYFGNNYEHYGVARTWVESYKSEGYILYFHTKGISAIYSDSNDHTAWKRQADESFIEMLKYYMIDNYKNCLSKLEQYDLCNVSDSYSTGWPSGNFWWATKSYVRDTNYPHNTPYDRWASECWVNFNKVNYKVFQFYDRFGFRDKFTYIPEASYKNPQSLNDKKIILLSAKLMTIMEPENENDLDRPSKTHEVDFTEFVRDNLKDNNNKGFTNIKVSFTDLGRVIEDPCYGVLKSLVIEFKIEDDDTIYRLVGDEGQILNYIINKPSSSGDHFLDNNKIEL